MRAPAGKREREEMVATDSSDTNKEKKGVEKKKNERGLETHVITLRLSDVRWRMDGWMDGRRTELKERERERERGGRSAMCLIPRYCLQTDALGRTEEEPGRGAELLPALQPPRRLSACRSLTDGRTRTAN